jgi:hypothetical protein
MRILHVENVAGVGSALSRAQRGLGHESDVLITWPNRFEFEVDHEHVYQGKGIRLPSEMLKVLSTCRGYDVLHVHGGLTRKRIDILLSRMTTKQILIGHYHGSETRQGYGLHYRRFIDLGVVATPDLLRWLPGCRYVPNPVELPESTLNLPETSSTKIVHIPSDRRIKGTEIIEEAVRKLKGSGLGVDLTVLEGVPHGKAMEEVGRSHIVADWISREEVTGVPGIYGKLSLEAMARGRVAISYIDPGIRALYPDDLPVISPTGTTADDLADCLAPLIRDRHNLEAIAAKGPSYVRSHHDPEATAQWFVDQYQALLAKR